MDTYGSRRNSPKRARERQMVRQRRREGLSAIGEQFSQRARESGVRLPPMRSDWMNRARLFVSDVFWYVTHSPQIMLGLAGIALVIFLIFVGSHVFTGRIFPNVWALGLHLGDLTVDEAALALDEAWRSTVRLKLVDGDRSWVAAPTELGMSIDSRKTAEAARAVGLSGIPFGYGIRPVVAVDYTVAQAYLLDLTETTDYPPHNATFRWEAENVVGVPGTDGRMLDIPNTLEKLIDDPIMTVLTQRLDLVMQTLEPVQRDPEPFLEDARAFASQPLSLSGYDPFLDQSVIWQAPRDVVVTWLEAGEDGLTLRDDVFALFLDAQNQSLNTPDGPQRFLDPRETRDSVMTALQTKQTNVNLRIRYRDTQYEVVRGDTGFKISRKTGIPYYLIEEANPNRDLNVLSVGDIINLPSRDKALPLPPVANKRIVVNLDTQSLMAFENGQVVFNWLISSGISSAPTSPGIYQVLSHNEVASGSSFTLCAENGLNCGQWEMYWFMGMYEVQPGLMNGFHGAVLLPNGTYLGGGNVGAPYTFGCVMSLDSNAKLLYDWADLGTVVEIISGEFPPQSDLGRLALQQTTSLAVTPVG
jgi:hypothetical protein